MRIALAYSGHRLAELIANRPEPPAWKPDNVFARHCARPVAPSSGATDTP